MTDKSNESPPGFTPRTDLVSQIKVHADLNIQAFREELGAKIGIDHPFFEAYELFSRQRSLNEEMLQAFEESRDNGNSDVRPRSKTLKAWHALKSYCAPSLRRRKVEKTRISFNEATRNVAIIEYMCRERAAGLDLAVIQEAVFGRIPIIDNLVMNDGDIGELEPIERELGGIIEYISDLIKKASSYESKNNGFPNPAAQ